MGAREDCKACILENQVAGHVTQYLCQRHGAKAGERHSDERKGYDAAGAGRGAVRGASFQFSWRHHSASGTSTIVSLRSHSTAHTVLSCW